MGEIGSLFAFLIVLLVVVGLWFWIATFWTLFQKTGHHGWGVLIPPYAVYIWFRIAKFSKKSSIILSLLACTGYLAFIPLIAYLMSCFKIATAFDRTWVFGLCLLLFPIPMIPLLAFDDFEYEFDEEEEYEY